MEPDEKVGILGVGYELPATVRTNKDPIFDWLHDNQPPGKDLFKGFVKRRVLAPGETAIDLCVSAAEKALAMAGGTASDFDLLLGTVSLSEYPEIRDKLDLAVGRGDRDRPRPWNRFAAGDA